MQIGLRKRLPLNRLFSFLVIAGVLACRHVVIGQELSILKAVTNYTIWASPSAGAPQTLQATENFRLWIDVTNDFTDPFSLSLKYPQYSSRYFRVIPSAPEVPPIRIICLGDSLSSDISGWGGGMYDYLKPNATFINYASPGRWSGSAVASNSFERPAMLSIRPDYVFATFGVADLPYGTTLEEFEANLKALNDLVHGWNGVLFLVTVPPHRIYSDGKFTPNDNLYNPVTRRVAVENQIPLIDLNKIVSDLYSRLGPVDSDFMRFTGFPNDTYHFSPLGMLWVAQLVTRTFPPSFGPYLTEKVLDPPPAP